MEMTRQPYDQYCKECLLEILHFFGGSSEAQRPIHPKEVYYADISFEPPPSMSQADLKKIGVLGNMISTACLIEYFWEPPSQVEVCVSLMKLFSWYSDLSRKGKKEKKRLGKTTHLPRLWIVATSVPDALLTSFDVKLREPNWCKGIYFFGDAMNTGIVVIDRLPATLDTIWLRILGKGAIQEEAIKTLATLKDKEPLHSQVLDVLHKWHADVLVQDDLTPKEEELLMILSPAYEESRRKAIQQGIREDRHLVVENMLKLRFGEIDNRLSQVIEPLVEMSPENSLDLLMHLSREELLAQLELTGTIQLKRH